MSTQINDAREKKRLLGEMVDFRDAVGAPAIEWMEYFVTLLIDMPTRWTKEPLTLNSLPDTFWLQGERAREG
jgi:hypothetical protein